MGQVLNFHATAQSSFNFYVNLKNEYFSQAFQYI